MTPFERRFREAVERRLWDERGSVSKISRREPGVSGTDLERQMAAGRKAHITARLELRAMRALEMRAEGLTWVAVAEGMGVTVRETLYAVRRVEERARVAGRRAEVTP